MHTGNSKDNLVRWFSELERTLISVLFAVILIISGSACTTGKSLTDGGGSDAEVMDSGSDAGVDAGWDGGGDAGPVDGATPDPEINGAGNHNNQGLATADETWIYYSVIVYPDSDTGGFYRTRTDGSGSPEKLSNDAFGDLIVVDGIVYTTNYDNDYVYIQKFNMESRKMENISQLERQPIKEGSSFKIGLIKNFSYNSGNFYFLFNVLNIYVGENYDHGMIYKVPVGGGEPKYIGTEEASLMGVGKGYIFYRSYAQRNLYRMDLNGTGRFFMTDHISDQIAVSWSKVYYYDYDEHGIASSNFDGTGKMIVVTDGDSSSISHFNVAEDYVYFSSDSWDPRFLPLARIKKDGTGLYTYKIGDDTTEEGSINLPNINIVGNKLYCTTLATAGALAMPFNVYTVNRDGAGCNIIWNASSSHVKCLE